MNCFTIKPGDVIVLSFNEKMSPDEREKLREDVRALFLDVKDLFSFDMRVVALFGASISVLSPEATAKTEAAA